jgi:hypothetical protein
MDFYDEIADISHEKFYMKSDYNRDQKQRYYNNDNRKFRAIRYYFILRRINFVIRYSLCSKKIFKLETEIAII